MTRLLVCGSRTWAWHERLLDRRASAAARDAAKQLDAAELVIMYRELDALLKRGLVIECVIHGAAGGADRRAGEWARGHELAVIEYPAQWMTYGRSAGPIRNRLMLDDGKPDLVVAFRDVNVESIGTGHMIATARVAGVPVQVYKNRARGAS